MIEQLPARVIFGGTFDPVHHGHLRSALELAEVLEVNQVDLIPSRDPVHRAGTDAPAFERLQMLEQATASEPSLVINRIELDAQRESYTLFTLQELRAQLGPDTALILVVGMDAFQGLESWKGWEELLDYAHLLVLKRPGYQPHFSDRLHDLYQQRSVPLLEELRQSPAGKICLFEQTPLEVSATQVRQLIAAGASPRYLIPDAVWDYIQEKELYGFQRTETD